LTAVSVSDNQETKWTTCLPDKHVFQCDDEESTQNGRRGKYRNVEK